MRLSLNFRQKFFDANPAMSSALMALASGLRLSHLRRVFG
jgi:hypothetical protein